MNLNEAIILKLSEHTTCYEIKCTPNLISKANLLIDFFQNKYNQLHLILLFERDFSADFFTAWSEFIDSAPNMIFATHPAYLLLSPTTEAGHGPFLRWLQNTASDSDEVLVMGAALDLRVPRFVKSEFEIKRQKDAIKNYHETYTRKYENAAKRLAFAVRDYFVNDTVICGKIIYGKTAKCEICGESLYNPNRFKAAGIRELNARHDLYRNDIADLYAYIQAHKSASNADKFYKYYNIGRDLAQKIIDEWEAEEFADFDKSKLVVIK